MSNRNIDELLDLGCTTIKTDLYDKKHNEFKECIAQVDRSKICEPVLGKHSCFLDLIKDIPELIEILKYVFPQGYHMVNYSSCVLKPGMDLRGWCVNKPYSDMQEVFPAKTQSVQVVIPLVNLTLDNGATAWIPMSHKEACNPTPDAFSSKDFKRRVIETQRGEITVFLGKTWVSHTVNKTNRDTIMLHLNYSSIDYDIDPIVENAFSSCSN
jgi:ectoine hydroxylase-related dioxygenase (phytanoyl-CoA dioxygenase family)